MKKIRSKKLKKLKTKYFPDEKKTSYIIIAIFVWASWATLGAIRSNYQLQQKVDELDEKIALLQLENERLEFTNEFFETDEYLDLSARQNFNKIAPGERILVLPQRDDQFTNDSPANIISKESDRSNFAQWLDFLFSVDI